MSASDQAVRIVLTIEGGVCQGVFCSSPARVGVLDHDNGEIDPECAEENALLEEEIKSLIEVL